MAHKYQSKEVTSMVEEDCCDTACLIQPRFFHGQLLTDADLNQLLSWTEGKFRLQRTANGWGVVCGLHLSIDPAYPTRVLIHPGQGIDCCGRDLVVCEPISFDVSDACPKEECIEPTYNRWGSTKDEEGRRETEEYPHPYPEPPHPSQPNTFQDSRVLDLFLHYATEGDDALVRLGGRGNECEYSRMKETVKPKWEEARDWRAEENRRLQSFEKEYLTKREEHLRYIDEVQNKAANGESIRAMLLRDLDAQPLRQFGFVREWIQALENNDNIGSIVRILFFKTMDKWLIRLRCDCMSCSPETGLRVGRLWLQGPDSSGNNNCRILWVDDQSPYRRELHKDDCFPAPAGCVNLAPYLWQDWDVVSPYLSQLGILHPSGPDPTGFEQPDWNALRSLYERANAIMNCDLNGLPRLVRPIVARLGQPFGDRVVGFDF
jgi:hypothetical protein